MLNRYQGNTGRVQRIDDAPAEPLPTEHIPTAAENTGNAKHTAERSAAQNSGKDASGALDKLAQLVPNALEELRNLETEDILLLLILYLMYRESGDTELLIIICAMLLP